MYKQERKFNARAIWHAWQNLQPLQFNYWNEQPLYYKLSLYRNRLGAPPWISACAMGPASDTEMGYQFFPSRESCIITVSWSVMLYSLIWFVFERYTIKSVLTNVREGTNLLEPCAMHEWIFVTRGQFMTLPISVYACPMPRVTMLSRPLIKRGRWCKFASS